MRTSSGNFSRSRLEYLEQGGLFSPMRAAGGDDLAAWRYGNGIEVLIVIFWSNLRFPVTITRSAERQSP